jgi:hypothetical protein
MSTAITHYEGSSALAQWREPEEVLAQAKKAAVALKNVLDMKENKVMFNNEQYLEREDWGTAGRFFNCTAKSIETRYVEFPDGNGGVTRGFEAVAVVVDMNTMNEVGRAESMCLDEEESWGDVTVYEWKDKIGADGKKIWNPNLRKGKGGYEAEKVAAGTKKKPLFQLRSMAQTRAEAKALKGVFSWFVVLAGYKPTPAEELTGHEDFGDPRPPKEPVKQPTRASEKQSSKEADTKTQTKTGSTTGSNAAQTTSQAAEQPAGDEVSGIIENAEAKNNGIWKLTIGGKGLLVPADKYDTDMVKGKFIKARYSKRVSEKNGEYWVLEGVRELSDVQESEPEKQAMDPENAALAAELFPDDKPAAGKEAVQGMIDNGQLKPASSLPATKKPGSIGKKRQIRLDSLCNSNKEKNNGFNHEEIKKILSALPSPVDHVQDMEENMYPQFEKWATGEEDWREFWKE